MIKKLSASILLSVFALTLFAGSASASTIGCIIEGNGSGSDNDCNISIRWGRRLRHRHNFSWGGFNVSNNVWISAKTGGNDANDNTGGTVEITSGDVDVQVTISN